MFVRSVRIRNYKSLANVELTNLTPVTILVGTNAVGKSNLVDALRFLRDMVVDGLDHAVSKRGGMLPSFRAGGAATSRHPTSRVKSSKTDR